jgi:GT2 family glycosyltransferase
MAAFEAVVVDNASTDGGPVLPADPRFRLVQMDRNAGFAAANNRAAAGSQAKWFAALNPDAFAEPDWLEKLIAAGESAPDVTMVGSLQIGAESLDTLDGAGDCYHAFGIAWRGLYGAPRARTPATGEVFGPCAAAALYRMDAFKAAGGFDERFFCYHEDVDLAFRLRLAGGRCIQSAEARVAHVGSGVTGRQSDFSVYHGVRNRIWTFVKCMPAPLFWLLIWPHLVASIYLLARSGSTGTFTATLRGMRDGWGGLGPILQGRKAVQVTRTTRLGVLARAFTWSLRKLRLRDHDVRQSKR